jgi:hypothetical protein
MFGPAPACFGASLEERCCCKDTLFGRAARRNASGSGHRRRRFLSHPALGYRREPERPPRRSRDGLLASRSMSSPSAAARPAVPPGCYAGGRTKTADPGAAKIIATLWASLRKLGRIGSKYPRCPGRFTSRKLIPFVVSQLISRTASSRCCRRWRCGRRRRGSRSRRDAGADRIRPCRRGSRSPSISGRCRRWRPAPRVAPA